MYFNPSPPGAGWWNGETHGYNMTTTPSPGMEMAKVKLQNYVARLQSPKGEVRSAEDEAADIVRAYIRTEGNKLWYCDYFKMLGEQGEMCDEGSAFGTHDRKQRGCGWVWVTPTMTPPCDHEFVDADNEYVSGAELCLKCGAIRAKGENYGSDDSEE